MIWITEAINPEQQKIEDKWNDLSQKITAAKEAGARCEAPKKPLNTCIKQAYVNYGYRYAQLQIMLTEMKFGKVIDITQARKAMCK